MNVFRYPVEPRPIYPVRRPIERPGGYRGNYPAPPGLDRPIGESPKTLLLRRNRSELNMLLFPRPSRCRRWGIWGLRWSRGAARRDRASRWALRWWAPRGSQQAVARGSLRRGQLQTSGPTADAEEIRAPIHDRAIAGSVSARVHRGARFCLPVVQLQV